jgi:hypothetical protein
MSRQACNEKNCIAFIDKRENNFGGDVEPCDPGKQAQHFRPQLEEFLRRPVAPPGLFGTIAPAVLGRGVITITRSAR